jgi:hypothetical protein
LGALTGAATLAAGLLVCLMCAAAHAYGDAGAMLDERVRPVPIRKSWDFIVAFF